MVQRKFQSTLSTGWGRVITIGCSVHSSALLLRWMLLRQHREKNLSLMFLFCFFQGAVTISEERKVCTQSQKFVSMCESNEVWETTDRISVDFCGSVCEVMCVCRYLCSNDHWLCSFHQKVTLCCLCCSWTWPSTCLYVHWQEQELLSLPWWD